MIIIPSPIPCWRISSLWLCRAREIADWLAVRFLVWQLALQRPCPFPSPFGLVRLLLPVPSPLVFALLGRSSQVLMPIWSQSGVISGWLIQAPFSFTESQNHFGWNISQRSSSPIYDQILPGQLDHDTAFHVWTFLKHSRDGDSTRALGSPFQCLTTFSVKKFLLISSLNLPWCSLRLCPWTFLWGNGGELCKGE